MVKNKQPDEVSSARKYACQLLASSQKTVNEVTGRLLKKGFGVKTVEEVIEGLTKQNFLNDRECAMDYIEGKLVGEVGSVAIKYGMIKKGFKEEEVDKYIQEYYKNHSIDENELALSALSKKFKKYNDKDKKKYYQRIRTFLAGRGFPDEIISVILEEQINR